MQEINISYDGFQDPKKDEACFYLKEKSHYLIPPENQFTPSNLEDQEDHNETTNGNGIGIYLGFAAAGSYNFVTRFLKV